MSDVPDVEDFSASLVDDFANVDEARNQAGSEESLRRIVTGDFKVVENRVGGDRFGNDVASALSAGIRADIMGSKRSQGERVR